MGRTEIFRSSTGHGLSVGATAAAAAIDVVIALSSGTAGLLHFGAIPFLGAAAVWATFDRPVMRLSDEGIDIRNIVRRTHVPWQCVTAVEEHWGMQVGTESGTHSVWAISAAKRPALSTLLSGSAGGAPAGGYGGQSAVRWESTSLLEKNDKPRGPARNRAVARTIERWSLAREENFRGSPRLDDSPSTSWNMDVIGVCGILAVLVVLGLVTAG